MEVKLSRKERLILSWVVGIILVLLIASNILLWREELKCGKNVQGIINYLNQQGNPQPQNPEPQNPEQPKEEVKKDGK